MDDSISLNRLTTEILEASLSRQAVNTDGPEELEAFLKAADCNDIRMQFIGVAAYVQTGRIFHDLSDVAAFVDSGELDTKRAIEVLLACTKFFMVGWHARGALEDIEKLKQVVRTS
jgi:hypothetical protein